MALGAQFSDVFHAGLQILVVGFNGKAEITAILRIFMSAVDHRFIRQISDFAKGIPHLLRRSFEQTPAAHGKQCVAAEQGFFFGKPEGRKCYEILKGNLFSCASCPTFEVMKHGIPEIRTWETKGKVFKSLVMKKKHDLVSEVLKEEEPRDDYGNEK